MKGNERAEIKFLFEVKLKLQTIVPNYQIYLFHPYFCGLITFIRDVLGQFWECSLDGRTRRLQVQLSSEIFPVNEFFPETIECSGDNFLRLKNPETLFVNNLGFV